MNAISLTDTPAQQDAQLADLADNLHVTSIRIDLDWRWVQYQSSSAYDWSLYDPVVSELAAYHLSALFIIQGCANWACPGAVNALANAMLAEEFGSSQAWWRSGTGRKCRVHTKSGTSLTPHLSGHRLPTRPTTSPCRRTLTPPSRRSALLRLLSVVALLPRTQAMATWTRCSSCLPCTPMAAGTTSTP
jgi:hypothetical protein